MSDDLRAGDPEVDYLISYGKKQVPFYRVHARPLTGLTPIPESAFTGRSNVLFACEVDVVVLGEDFLPAYTVGDNSLVVATDSMKNIIIKQALAYDGATHEGYLASLARTLIDRYDHLRDLQLDVREIPFPASTVTTVSGTFGPSDVLFDHVPQGDHSVARMRVRRGTDDAAIEIVEQESGRVGLRLLKVTGSSFTAFVHDEHTTLPDRRDRPLFISLDVFWTYLDANDWLGDDPTRYVAGEQVGDLCRTVFHDFVSESIQHLVHEMGLRMLGRFPQLAAIRFVANNLTKDPFHVSEVDPTIKVYSDPFPAFGEITLRMTRKTASGKD
ncbi:MAG: factor-independent urate hydroxylase [Thermomicrobiales bacterium]